MQAHQALVELGGIADAATLNAWSSRGKVRTALSRRLIVRISRGRYALPDVESGVAAARIEGVVSHLSAALHWQWELKSSPARPHVTVPRGRNVPATRRIGVAVHWIDLGPGDAVDGVTSPLRTVIDCARDLPFDAALAVADSALRSGDVDRQELRAAAAVLRGPGARGVRRVAEHADARARNGFESATRAIAIDCGLSVVVEAPIEIGGVTVHPDLVDASRRLVIEADSWGFHAGKEAHDADCWRYTMLTTAGWHVLRFTWEQVMRRPTFVTSVLQRWVQQPQERPQRPETA
ncbi:hypothetical protein ASG90_02620 [Nocardioides sp. Soil797]|nr:hypothetical protein ASG90_02620 [Nocardioides sp. Soil797]